MAVLVPDPEGPPGGHASAEPRVAPGDSCGWWLRPWEWVALLREGREGEAGRCRESSGEDQPSWGSTVTMTVNNPPFIEQLLSVSAWD